MNQNTLKYIFFFVYSVLISFVAYHHELWRDEADAWLVARDIDFYGLLIFSRNAGHPALWYWILIPFAKLGFPNYTIMIIHVLIAISASYIILFYSTYRIFFSIPLIFGYYFFYEYGVIARNYAISNLLLFLAAALYQKRFERPILFGVVVFFLANCNIYATVLASGIGLIYLIEVFEKKEFKSGVFAGVFLMFFGGLVCLLQIIRLDNKSILSFNSMAMPVAIVQSFSPGTESRISIFVGFIIIVLGFIVFSNTKKVFLFYIWTFSILTFFVSFIYMSGFRHAGFFLLFFLFSLWIFPYYEKQEIEKVYDSLGDFFLSIFKEKKKLLHLLLLISAFYSIRFSIQEARKDILYSFSNAKEMSEFIIANGYDSDKYIFSAQSADNCKTVLFYLKNKKNFIIQGLILLVLICFGMQRWD